MKQLPRAVPPWALDSGGFTEIAKHGRHTVPARQYAAEVRRWRDEIGFMCWAAIQDWMCEPKMLEKTGRTVEDHQRLTVNSWITLNSIDGELPWVPVLQGWTVSDYHRHADLYERFAGTHLARLPVVAVGTLCKRQATAEVRAILSSLWQRGLRNLHGFGLKTKALTGRRSVVHYLKSADSMAWSFRARKALKHDGLRLCHGDHEGSCANCERWMWDWHQRLRSKVAWRERTPVQELLPH